MFVRQSKHDAVLKELVESRQETLDALTQVTRVSMMHKQLQDEWNDVINQINDKGGRAFLEHGELYGYTQSPVKQFTDAELRSLLQLVHPDKHEGKQSAHTLTQKILSLRG